MILGFTGKHAEELRAEGEAAALEYVAKFKDNEEFAIFLRKLEAYKQIFSGGRSTFLFDWKMFPEFRNGPKLGGTP